MWTLLLDLLFYAVAKPSKTPLAVAIAFTAIIIGCAFFVIITKSDI
jgi:hypothetical protein